MELSSEALNAQFGLRPAPEDWIELDSSSATKFSRHLVCRLPGAAFRGTAAAGAFARSVVVRRCPGARREHGIRSLSSHVRDSLPPLSLQAQAAGQREASASADALFVRKQAGGERVRADAAPSQSWITRAHGVSCACLTPEAAQRRPPLSQTLCVIDGAVYTRNRAFRLYLSSKARTHSPPSRIDVFPVVIPAAL